MAKPKSISVLSPTQLIWFLNLAQQDFERASRAAREARSIVLKDASREEQERRLALGEAAIVRYARPFRRCVIPQTDKSLPRLSVELRLEDLHVRLTGAKAIHEGILATRDSIAAHTDVVHRPVHLRRRDLQGVEWRIDTACFVPDLGDENLFNLIRIADALADRTVVGIGLLVRDHFPSLPLDVWRTVSPDGFSDVAPEEAAALAYLQYEP